MKNYEKIYQRQETKHIELLKKQMNYLQENGDYPTKFEFPVTVQFELTGQCNLKCQHCYNRSGDTDVATEAKMAPKQWVDLSKHIVENGGIFQCIISGGEPLLLGDDLFDIMDILHNDGTSFVLITNGYLLTKEKVSQLKKYRYYWLQVSIDGATPEIHDEFRGVPSSWERAVKGAFEVTKAGIPLVIAHTVTPKSLGTLDKMVTLAYELGASSIILGEVLPSGRAYENQDILLTQEQRNLLYNTIEELREQYNGKLEIQRSASVKYQMERYQIQPNSGVIVRPNGDLRIDCMAPFTIGNIFEKRFAEIWQEKAHDCWSNEAIENYIRGIDEATQGNFNIKNHFDKDIRL